MYYCKVFYIKWILNNSLDNFNLIKNEFYFLINRNMDD